MVKIDKKWWKSTKNGVTSILDGATSILDGATSGDGLGAVLISRSQPKILRKIRKKLRRYISTISRFLHVCIEVNWNHLHQMIVGINASLLLDLMIWIIFEFFRFIREGFKIPTNPPASHSGIPLSPLPCLQRKTHFMHNLDIFQIMGTLYGLSGHFADHLDTFQIILILCTASGYF